MYQEHIGHLYPVNQNLTLTEINYPIHKLVFIALKLAIADKLKDYLYNTDFEVKTNNNMLMYILTMA